MDGVSHNGCAVGKQAAHKFYDSETNISHECPANPLAALIAMVRVIMHVDCLLAQQATVFIHY